MRTKTFSCNHSRNLSTKVFLRLAEALETAQASSTLGAYKCFFPTTQFFGVFLRNSAALWQINIHHYFQADNLWLVDVKACFIQEYIKSKTFSATAYWSPSSPIYWWKILKNLEKAPSMLVDFTAPTSKAKWLRDSILKIL